MASVIHTLGLEQWMAGTITTSSVLKALLVLDTYTPDASHEFVDEIAVTYEIIDAYVRPTLGTVVLDSVAGKVRIDAANLTSFNLLGDEELVGYVSIYKENIDDTDSVLLATLEGPSKFTGDGAGGDAAFDAFFAADGFLNLLTV